jgi:hypothetical protein
MVGARFRDRASRSKRTVADAERPLYMLLGEVLAWLDKYLGPVK